MKPIRRTKIVATLGPATDNEEILASMLEAGMNCARLNCSHSDHEELIARAKQLREVSKKVNRPVAILFDLQGPKLRLSNQVIGKNLGKDERAFLVGNEEPINPGDILVATEKVVELVSEDSEIVIGDGYPRMKVIKVHSDRIEAIVTSPGRISSGKGVAITQGVHKEGSLTEKDYRDLKTAVEVGADFIALSFVRSANDIRELKNLLKEHKSRARVVAKVEKLEAMENVEEIIEISDGVLVARGDYGVEAGLAEVPLMQKKLLFESRRQGVLAITATQMMESMIDSPLPTRAEASDVANAVLDGTSAVMLSAETAVGKYPVEAVQTMKEIILSAESFSEVYSPETHPLSGSIHDAVMRSAVTLAAETNAKALIIPTSSGTTARAASRYRPEQPILALSPYQRVCDQLALEWGIKGTYFKEETGTTDLIERMTPIVKETLGLKAGDRVVATRGDASGPNLITLVELK